MEMGQWELGEMIWLLLESHPILKQSGPHSMASSCSPSCAFEAIYGNSLPLPANQVGVHFALHVNLF